VLQQVRAAQEQWHRLNWLYRLAQAIERVQFRIGVQRVRRAPCELRDQRLGIAPPLAVAATGSMLRLRHIRRGSEMRVGVVTSLGTEG